MVAKSNIKVVKLDLQDGHTSNATIASLRPGKGRYHSLLGLLSNTKLRGLHLSNLYLLGTRTSSLPSSFSASWLQCLRYHGRVYEEDRHRLTNIISHCSGLVELALACQNVASMDLHLHQAVFTLEKLKRLHLSGWIRDKNVKVIVMEDRGPMTELIYPVIFWESWCLTKIIRQSSPVLKVLVLNTPTGEHVDLTPETSSPTSPRAGPEESPSELLSGHHHLSSLTHLDLQVSLSGSSLEILSTILPRLDLTHFGCDQNSYKLLQHCNLKALKSLPLHVVSL